MSSHYDQVFALTKIPQVVMNIYELLTKCEVKIWLDIGQVLVLRVYGRNGVEVHKLTHTKKERGQYPDILLDRTSLVNKGREQSGEQGVRRGASPASHSLRSRSHDAPTRSPNFFPTRGSFLKSAGNFLGP